MSATVVVLSQAPCSLKLSRIETILLVVMPRNQGKYSHFFILANCQFAPWALVKDIKNPIYSDADEGTKESTATISYWHIGKVPLQKMHVALGIGLLILLEQ